jgi:hypothetical protein
MNSDIQNMFKVISIDRTCVSARIMFSRNSRKRERLKVLYDLIKEVKKKATKLVKSLEETVRDFEKKGKKVAKDLNDLFEDSKK